MKSNLLDKNKFKMKKKRKKYATGTSIKSYMENPYDSLQKNNMNLAKAMYKANTNPLLIGLQTLSNLGMQVGQGLGGFGTTTAGNVANNILPILLNLQYALGGSVPNIPVEIEGDEVGETPDGNVFQAKGASHEQGGIDVSLPKGTEMFSKRIKIDNVSMADRKKKRKKKELTLEELINKNVNDNILKNSLKRTKLNNQKEENFDINVQNLVNNLLNNNKEKQKYKEGGIVELVPRYPAYSNPELSKVMPPEPKWWESGLSDIKPIYDEAKPIEEKPIEEKQDNFFSKLSSDNLNIGNTIGITGDLVSSFGPYFNTLKSRKEDTPNINPYLDYGEKGLKTIENTKGYINQQRDEKLKDLELARNSTIRRLRNSSRGANTMRALDLATQQNMNKIESDIYNTYAEQMMKLLLQQSAMENQQDKIVMQGESLKDTNDRKDKDNYYTQMAENILGIGKGLQETGKDLNTVKTMNAAMNLINLLSKYGIKLDKNANIVNKNK